MKSKDEQIGGLSCFHYPPGSIGSCSAAEEPPRIWRIYSATSKAKVWGDIHLQKCAKVKMVKQLQMHGVGKVLLLLKAFTIPLHLFWMEDLGLTLADKEILVNGKWLTDNLMNAGQRASIC